MYREFPAALPGAVCWTSVSGGAPVRVLPDGCLDLLWSSRSGLLVAGPDRIAYLTDPTPGERWLGLRLPPGIGPAVFGVPAVRRSSIVPCPGSNVNRSIVALPVST